jgi:flavodoxin
MATTAVYYLSKTGNTEAVAKAIAAVFEVAPIAIGEETILAEPVDRLFLGGALYGGGLDPKLKFFLKSLDKTKVTELVLFSTNTWSNDALEKMGQLAKKCDLPLSESTLHVTGHFMGLKKGHPDESDLAKATAFALSIKN